MNRPDQPKNTLALLAEGLYLANLLVLPGLMLLVLIFVFFRHRNSPDHLGRCHLYQTLGMSGWGLLMLGGGGTLLWFLLHNSSAGISMTLLYLIVIHTGFVLLGIIGLAKAISGQHFHPGSHRCKNTPV